MPGGLPDKAEIEKRIREAFPKVIEQSPEETLEVAGLCKLTYKKIPTDPKKIAQMLGKDITGGQQLPPGVDISQYAGMYQNEINSLLSDFMKDIGTIEVLKPIKVKSKTIPADKHKFGIVFEGDRPVALRIFNEDEEKLKKPIDIPLKAKALDAMAPELKIELKEPKKQKEGKEKVEIQLAFMQVVAKSQKLEAE